MPTESPPPRRRSCLMSVLSLAAFAVAAGTLMILPTGLIGSVFVLGGVAFFGLLALHYFVWGRWLSMELHQTEDRDSNEEDPR